MKKAVSILICLVMLLTCAAASAEEAVSQAELASAFQAKVNEFFAGMGPGKTLSFHVSPKGSQPLTGALSVIADGNGLEVDDLTIRLPGQEAPVQVQFGAAEQAIYLNYQGRVYALRMADLQKIIQSVMSMYAMPEVDSQIMQELAQLFVMNVIMPGIKLEQSQGAITVRVDLAVKDVAAGVARFVDQVMANERYWDAVKPLLQFIGMRQRFNPFILPLMSSGNANAMQAGDFAEQFEKNWPQFKKLLLAVETDGRLTADVIIRTVTESGTTAVVARITYSQNGQSDIMTLSAADNQKNFELGLTLASQFGGAAEPVTQATVDVKCDKQAGTLILDAALPRQDTDLKLTGSLTRRMGAVAIQGHLTVKQGSAAVVADADIFSADGAVTANVQVTANRMTVTGNLYWSKFVKTLTVNSQGQTLKAEIRSDEEGNFSAALTLPGSQGKFLAEGTVTANSLHCTVTYSDARSVLRGSAPVFSAEVTAAWSNAAVTANVTALYDGKVYAGQAYFSRSAQKISYQGGETALALNLQEDGQGKLALGRLTYTDSNSSSGSFEITYTPDAVVFENAQMKITFTAYYISENEHVIDAEVVDKSKEVVHVYNNYVDNDDSMDALKADSAVRHAYLRTRLIEEENRIEVTVENVMGQTALAAGAAIQPAGEIALLSQQNPIYITMELLQQLRTDPYALDKIQQAAPVEETAEEAVEEAVEEAAEEAVEKIVEETVEETVEEETSSGSSFFQQLTQAK